MKKNISMPQGKFQVGRDIPEGFYLIGSINELTFVNVSNDNNKNEYYTFNEDKTKMCYVELKKGDTLDINGSAIIRHIATNISKENNFNLFGEIEDFDKYLRSNELLKKNFKITEKTDKKDDLKSKKSSKTKQKKASKTKQKTGFLEGLGILFSAMESSSTQEKKHNGKCDGDCENCPPHYGYRYGRWYYGHNHIEGCVFGGNKGSGGED